MPLAKLAILGTEPLDRVVELSQSVRLEPQGTGDACATLVRELRPAQQLCLRHWLDQSLLMLRLWRPGAVACRNAVCTGLADPCDPQWYSPWKTWCHSSLERPLRWDGAESELPELWRLVAGPMDTEDHRLRRFSQLYFYPVAVDRFSMLFMAADGLLFPYHTMSQSSKCGFGRRGARLLRGTVGDRSGDELEHELIAYYKTRNGEFHGTARTSGAQIQAGCERLEHYVRLLITHFLHKGLMGPRQAAEEHIRCALAAT